MRLLYIPVSLQLMIQLQAYVRFGLQVTSCADSTAQHNIHQLHGNQSFLRNWQLSFM
jgi:hypothetical protein